MAGRPTKLTQAVHDRVVMLLRAGNYLETASSAAGVSSSTLREWMRRGAREQGAGKKSLYAKFFAAVDVAMAESEARDVALIAKAATADWRAAAWRLEHRHQENWASRQRHEHRLGGKRETVEDDLAAIRAGIAEVFGYGASAAPEEASPTDEEHTPPVDR